MSTTFSAWQSTISEFSAQVDNIMKGAHMCSNRSPNFQWEPVPCQTFTRSFFYGVSDFLVELYSFFTTKVGWFNHRVFTPGCHHMATLLYLHISFPAPCFGCIHVCLGLITLGIVDHLHRLSPGTVCVFINGTSTHSVTFVTLQFVCS